MVTTSTKSFENSCAKAKQHLSLIGEGHSCVQPSQRCLGLIEMVPASWVTH